MVNSILFRSRQQTFQRIYTLDSLCNRRVEGNEKVMRYAIVIEKAPKNYSAYVPDLPVHRRIREAIDMHLEGMREDRLRIPKPSARAQYIETSLPRRKAG